MIPKVLDLSKMTLQKSFDLQEGKKGLNAVNVKVI